MGNWIYQYDIAAIVLLTVVLWMLLKFKNLPLETTKYFKWLLISAILASVADLWSIYTLLPESQVSFALQNIAQISYLIPNMLCASFYFAISCAMTRPFRNKSLWRIVFFCTVEAADIILTATSPFTQLIFYIEDGVYKHGPLMILRYGAVVLIMFFALFDAMRFHRLMTKAQKRLVYSYTFLCLLALIVQGIFDHIMLLNFAISVSALLGYFALQNPTDFQDELTGFKNKQGLLNTTASYFQHNDSFSLICIYYKDFDYIKKIMGADTVQKLIQQLAVQLAAKVPRAWLYHITRSKFVIVLPHHAENLPKLVEDIQSMSEGTLMVNSTRLHLKPIIATLHAPESFNYSDDAMDAINYALEQAENSPDNNRYCDVAEASLVKNRRESAILHILKRAITSHEFEIAYQPVYSMEQHCFTKAEALARLDDKALGQVSPSEFIPIAERNGLMPELGMVILDTVCRCISKYLHSESPIQRISINLSPLQCLQPNFADIVIDCAIKHNIPLSKLEFEITADTFLHARENLIPIMQKLQVSGVHFIVDDYSFAFGSSEKLTHVPFESIKITREAANVIIRNERMRPAIKHSIQAFKELGYSVIITGVETDEQSGLFREYGCDYMQGFLLSLPLSENQLAELMK